MKITLDTDNLADHDAIQAILQVKWRTHAEHAEVATALREAKDLQLMEFIVEADIGDLCRAACSAPARYIGLHYCVFRAAMDKELLWDRATPPLGDEEEGVVPTLETAILASKVAHLLPDSPEMFYKLIQEKQDAH